MKSANRNKSTDKAGKISVSALAAIAMAACLLNVGIVDARTFYLLDVSTAPPTIESFSVVPDTLGDSGGFIISYTVSDTVSSGLNRVELWRADDNAGSPGTWVKIATTSVSGNGSYSGSFSDTPLLPGDCWYAIYVADNAGNSNDLRNSDTAGVPAGYVPVKVTPGSVHTHHPEGDHDFNGVPDLNNDGILNFKDFAIFAFYWMDCVCSAPNCRRSDFDHSGRVDLADLVNFAGYWLWRRADIDRDGKVNFTDYAVLAGHWMDRNCSEPNWCDGADLDRNGSVDSYDLVQLVGQWLDVTTPAYDLADLDIDGNIDFVDYALLAEQWLNRNCTGPDWCSGCDFDKSGAVDSADLEIFADYWLNGSASSPSVQP